MLGVTRLILDSDEASASGDDDFFSVARTMPFVAVYLNTPSQILVPIAKVDSIWRRNGGWWGERTNP